MPAKKSRKLNSDRSPGRPRLEDVELIDNELVTVALEEFLQHGYGGTSMNRIVKAAGVSKTTLYSRFSSKEALFRAIVQQQIDQLAAAELLKTRVGSPDLVQGLTSYANRMLELSLQGELLGVNRLIYSESHRFPELGAAAAERTELGVKQISAFIEECAFADGIPCKDSAIIAEAFILMIRGWYINVMLTNRKVSPAQRKHWVDRAVHALLSDRSDW